MDSPALAIPHDRSILNEKEVTELKLAESHRPVITPNIMRKKYTKLKNTNMQDYLSELSIGSS